ncbi:MAG: hypothetical protein DCC68_13700 [Planctomycetota bacterium]|nr:MAG: hypothetical protein DCC68_13700 [Planctomycetota bacterium]
MFIALRRFAHRALVAALVVVSGFENAALCERPEPSPAPKLVRYVRGLIERHDRDRDGIISSQEWITMNGKPKLADADGDGRLTFEELLRHVASYARSRRLRRTESQPRENSPNSLAAELASADVENQETPRSIRGATQELPATKTNGASVRRFTVPESALPGGLPDWFLSNDADGDGQLTMAEFGPGFTSDRRRDFARYDDGDGVLTAEEYLRGAGTDGNGR